MSVRAYKIIEIEKEKTPTFNCWSDNFLFEQGLIESDHYNNDGGFITISKDTIQDAIDSGNYEGEELKVLEQILDDFETDEDYQDYICY